MDIKSFVRHIADGNLTQDEHNAIVMALRESRKIRMARNAGSFKIGTIVQPFNMTPKEVNEIEGEIVEFSRQRKRVNIRVTKASPYGMRYRVGQVYRGFPVSNLAEVGTPAPLDVDSSDNDVNISALAAFLQS